MDNHDACIFAYVSEMPAVKTPIGYIQMIISLCLTNSGKGFEVTFQMHSSAADTSTSYKSKIFSARYSGWCLYFQYLGGSPVEGQSELHSEFHAMLGHIVRPCLKNKFKDSKIVTCVLSMYRFLLSVLAIQFNSRGVQPFGTGEMTYLQTYWEAFPADSGGPWPAGWL